MINNYPIPIVLANLRKLSEFKVGDSPVTDITGRLSIENREVFVALRRAVTQAFDVSVIEKTFADALAIQTTALRHSSRYARKTPYTEKAEIIADIAPAAFKGLQNLASTYSAKAKKKQSEKLLAIYEKYHSVIVKKPEPRVVRPLPQLKSKPSEIIVRLKKESNKMPPQPFSDLKKFWQGKEVKEEKILENTKNLAPSSKVVETKPLLEQINESSSEEKKVLPIPSSPTENRQLLIEKVIINSNFENETKPIPAPKKEKKNISSLIVRLHNDPQKKEKPLKEKFQKSTTSSQIKEITSQEQNKNKPLRNLLQEFFGSRGRPRFQPDIIDDMVSVRREKSKESALEEERRVQAKTFNIALIEKGKALNTKDNKKIKEVKKKKEKEKSKKSKTSDDILTTCFEEARNEEKLARQADFFKAVNKQRLTKSISCMIPKKTVDMDLKDALQRRRPLIEDSDSDSEEEFDFDGGKKSL